MQSSGDEWHAGEPENPADAHAPQTPPVPEADLLFQDDVDRLERLIRGEDPQVVPFQSITDKPGSEADDVCGAASDPADGAFDSFDAVTRRPEPADGHRRDDRPSPSGIRVFLALAGAIVTGAVFGYLVLWLFVGQPWASGSGLYPNPSAAWAYGMDKPAGETDGLDGEGTGSSGTEEDVPVLGEGDALTGKPGEAATRETAENAGRPPAVNAPAAAETMIIPADLFYFLQYGVFSSEERMKEALRKVRSKGLAAVAAESDGYRVYVGAAPTRDDAERLAKLLGDLQVYIKVLDSDPLILPADGLPADLPAFFEWSGDLARESERLSLALLRKDDTQSEEAWQRLVETHRQWRQTADALEGDPALGGETQTLALRVAARLDAAVQRLEDGRAGRDRIAPWDAQSAVMEALLDLERLRETLKSAVPAVTVR